ncbi:sugar phosphate isomerase/epimerase family protein [uncultured Paludibaculum sp.]|uniref:sugar phosphate isomerase/epimerase family protein n=1 Tax=uncultured Paludibaculum sp. TaxID=1765020 RepID=UPI002AABB637|nr:sugar phosphate isomerase/epimerase family protein [uncultured Paludibaculum sp.]
MLRSTISRRSFLATAAAASVVSAKGKKIPVGLELFSVRDLLQKDMMDTVRQVAKLGYQGVEFFSPYFSWTPAQAKDVRKLLDELNIKAYSTHNSASSFAPENIEKAIELNTIIGSKFIVMASSGRVEGLDGWKKVAATLTQGHEKFEKAGIRGGYHNHQTEFKPLDGTRPIEILAKETPKTFMLQLDIGTCIEAGSDPVAWINQNPGRINCIHCKDWSSDKALGYKVLFGEGVAPWKKIFEAAEKKGGIEYYLVEQEGSRFSSIESAQRCLESFQKIHG